VLAQNPSILLRLGRVDVRMLMGFADGVKTASVEQLDRRLDAVGGLRQLVVPDFYKREDRPRTLAAHQLAPLLQDGELHVFPVRDQVRPVSRHSLGVAGGARGVAVVQAVKDFGDHEVASQRGQCLHRRSKVRGVEFG
jgi:hypothetical protein